jgi:uncharacterized protein (TIGR02594 family)
MQQPEWLAAAWAELGQREISGSADNARIRGFFSDVGQPASLHDEVAWCAAFLGACLERSGLASTRSLMARSYLRWGEKIDEGRVGAVAVLRRGADPGAGHVGFLVGETPGHVILLGGNQGDAVSVAAYPKTRLIGLRWPRVGTAAPVATQTSTDGEALFSRALAHVLEMEGGLTDDPYDPGGPTNRGITLKVFADWKGTPLTAASRAALKAELKHIPDDVVEAIYRRRYWGPAHCVEMPAALAFFHFDAAVNHGVTGAMRLLQRAVGTDVDGEIGPNTRGAIARLTIEEALARYADVRRARYRALPHFWRFGRGWLARVDKTLQRAAEIAVGSPTTVDATPTPTPINAAEGARDMSETRNETTSETTSETGSSGKWWGQSVTIWGAIITGLSTVLPALGPLLGIDITGDLVREVGAGLVETVQAVGGLIGTVMTIYGRMRASQPIEQRSVSLKL